MDVSSWHDRKIVHRTFSSSYRFLLLFCVFFRRLEILWPFLTLISTSLNYLRFLFFELGFILSGFLFDMILSVGILRQWAVRTCRVLIFLPSLFGNYWDFLWKWDLLWILFFQENVDDFGECWVVSFELWGVWWISLLFFKCFFTTDVRFAFDYYLAGNADESRFSFSMDSSEGSIWAAS